MNRRPRLGSIRAAESSPDPKTPGVARDGGIPHDRPTPHPWIVRTTGRRDPDRRDRIDAPESPMPRTTSDRRLKSRNLRQQKKPDAIISHGATKLKSKNSLQRSHGKTDPPDNYRGGVRGLGRPKKSRTRKLPGSRGTAKVRRRYPIRPTSLSEIVPATQRRDPDRRDPSDAHPKIPMPRTTSDRRLKSRNLRQQKKPDAIISHGATKLKSKNSLQRSHGKTDPPDNYRGGVRGLGRPKKSRTRKLPGSRGTAKVRRRYPIRPTSLSEIVPATQRRDPDRRDPSDAHAAHAKFFGRPEGSRIRKPQGSRGTDGSQMNRRLRLGSARGAGEVPDPKTPGVARDGRFAHETTPSFSGQRCVWTIRGSSPIPRLKTRIIIHPPPCPQGTE